MDSGSDTRHVRRSHHVPPSIHVSSDTDMSITDPNEPSTSSGRRGKIPKGPMEVDVMVYDVLGELSRKHSIISDVELTPDTHLLDRAPVTADHLANIDSLSQGVLSRKDSIRITGMQYIDETPRGISDTARSSFVPAHLRNIKLPESNTLNVAIPPEAAYDPLRRYSTTLSEASSARSTEKGLQIQQQLHKLVTAFHERARQVKEQVVVQPPSPTLSDTETEVPPSKQTIPLHQMPIRPPSPGIPGMETRLPGQEMPRRSFSVKAHYWWQRFRVPPAFEPQSRRYITWLFIISIAFMYNAYAIPLRATFDFVQSPENLKYWFLVDYTCDVLYLIDILLMKTSVKFVSNGVWVSDRREIVGRYLRSWRFKLDVACSLPLDIFYLIPAIGVQPLLRLPKLLKLPSYWEFQSRVDQVARSPHLLRVLNSLAYMMWMIHANGCLFYYISELEGFGINHWVYNTSHPAYLHCFWRSFIVATAVGNAPEPENIVENAYMIFSWLVGVFVFALLIGQIRDIFTQMTYQEDHYQKTVDTAIRYMQNLRLPKELQANVRAWFTYNWEQHKTLDENSLLDGLPRKLKTDLVLCVHYNTLSKVQLFQGADQSLLRDLVLKLKPVVFLPNDYICRKGEVGKDMFIVRSGYLEVMTSDGKVVATLSEGSVFGEISLLSLVGGNRRTADVRSKGFSNLYVLRKYDLHEVLRDYPETQEFLKKKAQRLYQQVTPSDEKRLPKVEVIRSRSATPEFVRAVINVMNPHSSLKKRLSKPHVQVDRPLSPALSPVPQHPTGQHSSGEGASITGSNDERTPTPRELGHRGASPTPSVGNRRQTSIELRRKKREKELERRMSSDTESTSGGLFPGGTVRRRKSSRLNSSRSPSPRNKSPAPLAKLDSDESNSEAKTPRKLSFLPNFLAVPLRKLFNRPKISPVVVSADENSISENFEMVSSSKRKSRRKDQIYPIPPVRDDETVGSKAPSLHSSEEDYENLNAGPPDWDSHHSSDPEVIASRHIRQF